MDKLLPFCRATFLFAQTHTHTHTHTHTLTHSHTHTHTLPPSLPPSLLFHSEFFDQGDLERALGANTDDLQDLMNRQKVSELPKMQIGFIDFVAKPVYETLGEHFEDLAVLRAEVERNRTDWEQMRDKGPYKFITPVEVLTARTKSDVVGELAKRAEERVCQEEKPASSAASSTTTAADTASS